MSRPSWARGLKYVDEPEPLTEAEVAPLMGAWIEILSEVLETDAPQKSRPSWARGLKCQPWAWLIAHGMSRPSWARGLK